ncbi:Eco57I restriction-modification methylase domain-containing protein [Brachyspira aalborgi]|uniref:Eco57I restriction-modification methylase domain-containing protein n=1 Tax=Brachyspira aalborgi TaxID=29522 RepID=UPI0011C8FC45|nr:TaqI-like C-terminal specificity domain-containing protein [Brachyspira aalborgi]TXJ47567.1 type II restriction endonuclease [Brachyspira aalborgi]
MSKDFFRFDKEYSREEWTKYLGDNFKYEYGSIPNQNSIIEKYIDCLDDSNNKAIVWLGNLNVDEDIGVYEIRIKNTKTGSRVKISKICTDIIKSGNKNSFGKGIFFILYSNENEKAYRISYVKYDKKINENYEVKKDLSDPKRFTYLLGEGAKVKTAQSRLNKEAFSSVKKIEEAFSVEPVNKEFYKGIKISFDKIYKDVLKNFENEENADSDRLLSAKEFSLRFLGRALFCWFLREKDLIPKEIFDFINIDEMKTKDNYYKEVLEELFFNILNVKMEERKIESKIINKYEKQIPFLNGGLFLKKEDDYKVKTIDNEIIKELFEFFEKYNFTVDESAPFDIEISIDPEMLGRIFENLLAEINPESSASARKETGSFYTPREIVDYMVCESIKLYLYKKTQNVKADKIDNIFSVNEEADFSNEERNEILNAIHEMKILDIACGSGAFPMGILNRVFNIIDKLDSNHEFYKEFLLKNIKGQAREEFKKLYQANKFNYAYKLDMLQRMIHGVDIQPIAIEISRLRAFLSLIVDEEKESGHENLGIKALPNLEFNFISANSLISLEHKEKEQKEFSDETTEGIIKRMRNIAEEYFNADTVEKKIRIKTEFESLMGGIENKSRDILELDADDKKKFLSWNPFENKSTDFFDSEIQFGTKFFDIVIGNPPYIQIQTMSKSIKDNYKNAGFKSFASTGDIYQLFYEKSLNLLDKNGVASLITSNKWMRAGYGASTREYFYNNANVFKIIDLGAGRFSSATVDVNIIFYGRILQDKIEGERLFDAVNYKDDLEYLNLIRIRTQEVYNRDAEEKTALLSEVVTANLGKEWVIMNKVERSIFKKINKYKALKDCGISINRGITTGLNEAFIIDEETKDKLIKEDKKSAELIKPLIRGRDINRYNYDFKKLYFINTHNGLKEKNISPVNVNKYKAIKKHLDKYYSNLEIRQDKGITPYNLRNCTYIEDFEKPKIVYQEICLNASYSFDDKNSFLTNNAYMMISPNYNLKLLLGLLNSKLYWWFFTKNNVSLGSSGVRMLAMFIEVLPIPKVDKKTEDKIVRLVDKVIEKKRSKVDSSEEEMEIDRLVYELYNLSNEEIRLIEGK